MLRALARLDDGVSGRHLTKLAGLDSHMTVRRYLERLETIGLVEVRETPSARLYRANRAHIYWPAVEAILGARAAVEDRIAAIVDEMLGDDGMAAVYGSVARGDSRPDSDLDILLVVSDEVPPDRRTEVSRAIADYIEVATGNHGQVIDVSDSQLERLRDSGSPWVESLTEDAIPLGDRRLPLALLMPARRTG